MSDIHGNVHECCERVIELEAELAAAIKERDDARAALRLIAENGGCTTEEGLSCNGSWCAEQARRALDGAK
jgi:hypothetical protein